MSSGKKGKAAEPEVAGVDDNMEASNQEAVAIPYLAGEVRAKVTWLSPTYNQFEVEAPAATGGKK